MSESSAFQALLWEVSNKVSAATELVRETRNRLEALSREHGEMRERIAKLEENKVWNGDERRDIKLRLESGDHTFELIKAQSANAERDAAAASREVAAIRKLLDERGGTKGRVKSWLIKALIEGAVPLAVSAIVSGIGWIIYHAMFLAKLAEASKLKGGSP